MGLLDMFRMKSSTETSKKCLAHYETNLINVKSRKVQDILCSLRNGEQLIVEKSTNNQGGLCIKVKVSNNENETIGLISSEIVKEIEQNYRDFDPKIEWYKIYNNVDGIYECCVCLKIY
ncbi:MAG: hypothetical protein K0Q97_282 [Bacillota bacterium]|jgi:hypothetical protein|nr:hypothetical protein [Bacillota bacterium]